MDPLVGGRTGRAFAGVYLWVAGGCGGGVNGSSSSAPPASLDAGTPAPSRIVIGAPAKAMGDCPAGAPLCLRWPLDGREGLDWVITNYVDTDPSAEIADYTGAAGALAKTYDGHNGIDISIATFRAMDAGVVVHAAADGTVLAIVQGFDDRNTDWAAGCTDVNNYVTIRHESGYVVHYYHLRKSSVMVTQGQRVLSGAALGLVGSSGCSTEPHLHLEIRDTTGRVVDPSARRLLEHAAPYDAPLALMTTNSLAGPIDSAAGVKDPAPNVLFVAPGGTLGVGVVASSLHPGDRVGLRYDRPDGSTLGQPQAVYTMPSRLSFAYWNVVLGTESGDWHVAVLLNGVEKTSLTIPVR
jgi:murein DD-endopeptidase MepM/ murein hydrolase activator NlpD